MIRITDTYTRQSPNTRNSRVPQHRWQRFCQLFHGDMSDSVVKLSMGARYLCIKPAAVRLAKRELVSGQLVSGFEVAVFEIISCCVKIEHSCHECSR
jgi:hypothetical protein